MVPKPAESNQHGDGKVDIIIIEMEVGGRWKVEIFLSIHSCDSDSGGVVDRWVGSGSGDGDQ